MPASNGSIMRKRKIHERAYPPLQCVIERRVRFEEVDALAYMWHGRYASWFEDGREAFGGYHGISYFDFYDVDVALPIKTFSVTYMAPLMYGKSYIIETSLLWNDACLIEYAYRILNDAGSVMTKAETTQLMLTRGDDILLDPPAFYKAFCEKWKNGEIEASVDLR